MGERDSLEGERRGAASAGSGAPTPARKERRDKGVKRGPRTGPARGRGGGAGRISHLSLQRFRHGSERRVTDRMRAAVAEAAALGIEPWLMPAAGGGGGAVGAGEGTPGWVSEADEGSGSSDTSDTDGLEARWLDDADGDDVTAAGYQPRRPGGGRVRSSRKRRSAAAEVERAAGGAGESGERQRERQQEKRRRAGERESARAGE